MLSLKVENRTAGFCRCTLTDAATGMVATLEASHALVSDWLRANTELLAARAQASPIDYAPHKTEWPEKE